MRLLRKKAEPTAARRGQRRPRVVPWWRTRAAMAGAVAILMASAGSTGWLLWRSGVIDRLAGRAEAVIWAASVDLGLGINEVYVIGRHETPRAELLQVLGVRRGAPILAFDIRAARERVLALPWVRSVAVERRLPDTVVVRITERRPLALWQHQGSFALIDERGEPFLRQGLERFSDLLIVVGEDAAAHAPGLVDILRLHPILNNRVKTAVRVGGRRWNIELAGGIDVRLPEENPGAAWQRLAEYQRRHGVLERDVRVLDLRFPDQVIVRRAGRPEEPAPAAGRDT